MYLYVNNFFSVTQFSLSRGVVSIWFNFLSCFFVYLFFILSNLEVFTAFLSETAAR